MTQERHEFQAEVKQLLDLVVHSLYSDKDIFLRELVSNASDALDKLRFEQLTRPELGGTGELQIRLEADKARRTLSIIDNGIGMTRAEVVTHIGTIAKSGTKEFLAAVKEAQRKELPPELIGQFGVGFYSAFMVADKVVLETRKAGTNEAVRWESTGDGSYTVGEGERAEWGTTVTLHLKPADPEQGLKDYTEDHILAEIIKRYSDFVAYPIRQKRFKPSGEGGGEVLEDETLNSQKAIWDRPKSEVPEADYKQFYRHLAHDWIDPLRTLPVRMEGMFEAYALLFIPGRAPMDIYSPEMKRGLSLYVKRIFVMDECKELLPSHLRFVKGVVDAHDLSLNVSRELLQKDRQIQLIRKQLVKKLYGSLEEMKRDAAADYLTFWTELGAVLKEGLLSADDKDKVLDLVLSATTHGAELTSLDDYVTRMKPDQESIYFLVGQDKAAVSRSPLLEAFAAKGIEVLLFSDPVDEIWLDRAPKFKDKPLVSIGKGDVKLGTEDERKKATDDLETKQKEFADLLTLIRVRLQEDIKEVRLSNRLTTSPVVLVTDEHDLSPRMQRMLEQMGQKPPKAKRILELNPTHPLIQKLQAIFAADKNDPRLNLYADLLLGQAHLAETGQLPDPATFARSLAEVMLGAV
jgi:molecular chaperone HtpG